MSSLCTFERMEIENNLGLKPLSVNGAIQNSTSCIRGNDMGLRKKSREDASCWNTSNLAKGPCYLVQVLKLMRSNI